MSEETAEKVDAEIRKFVEKGYDRARKSFNRKKLMTYTNLQKLAYL